MENRIRINNAFRGLSDEDCIILSCDILIGNVEVGNKILIERGIELLICKVDYPKIKGYETNITIANIELKKSQKTINLYDLFHRTFIVVS